MVLGKRPSFSFTPNKASKMRAIHHSRARGKSPSSAEQSHMKVYIRIRPPNEKEINGGFKNIFKIVDQESVIFDPKQDESEFFFHGVKQAMRDINKKKSKEMEFSFDRVYRPDESNQDMYNGSSKHIITSILDGYNCSVFVYGATGAGKTHTMLGNENNRGIIYLTMVDLYQQIDECKDRLNIELGISYIEVYNENVQDLLNPGGLPLHLREDNSHGVVIAGMKLEVIHNPEHLFELLKQGNANRTQHPTDANAESSRSHAIFQVYVKMADKATQEMKMVKLSMIDLAGSERATANSSNAMRFKEGSNINKSLLALGNCINSLADGQKFVPYRDSKLTRILKDSLGGNCQTVMIANVGPTSLSYEDTYNTLKYASRAKNIKGKITKNVVTMEMNNIVYKKYMENCKTEVSAVKAENENLKKQIMSLTHQIQTQDFKNNRLNVDPQRREMNALFERERLTLLELLNLKSQKLCIQWRIHMKQMISDYLCNITFEQSNNVNCLIEDTKRIESSLAQFDGQLKSIDEKMRCLYINQTQITNEIRTWKRNLDTLVLETLKLEIALHEEKLYSLKKTTEAEHAMKLNSMSFLCIKSHNIILTEVSKKLVSYYCRLEIFGKVDNKMKDEHMNVLKQMKGIKNVKWLDDPTEEPYDVIKTFSSLDLDPFGSNDPFVIDPTTASSSPPVLSDDEDIAGKIEDDVQNTTQTLSSTTPQDTNTTYVNNEQQVPAAAPALSVTITKEPTPTTITRPVIKQIGISSVGVKTTPAATTSSSNNVLQSSLVNKLRVTNNNINILKNNNKVVRPVFSSSIYRNKSLITKRTPLKLKSEINKENVPNRFATNGLPKTPRTKTVQPMARTPAANHDPTIFNRLKSINEKLY